MENDRNRRVLVLPEQVINKIAAGEVVDRPASVLKELMENALDASAGHIEVEVVSGGKKAILVADDGCGMDRDNALLSLQRHATSKIKDVDDIERVNTLGFRGEALAAISSVSRFSLTTRPADAEAGVEILVNGGRIQDVRDTGAPVGTTIRVRNLFFNVPARRKFLRADKTELSHVRQTFIIYALSNPQAGFRLVVDEREVYQLSGAAGFETRLRELYGGLLCQSLRPVEFNRDGMTLNGFVSLPQVTRGDRNDQFLFINRRPVWAPLISYALNEAYHAMIPKSRYPVVFLNLIMDPAMVDVNVHPTKKEVRFRNGRAVRDIVIEGLRQALAVGSSKSASIAPVAQVAPLPVPNIFMPQEPATVKPDLPVFPYPRKQMIPEESRQDVMHGILEDAAPAHRQDNANERSENSPWSWFRVLGHVADSFIVMETDEGVVFMDPHAAHERVLFERFMREAEQSCILGQSLLSPETVALQPHDALAVRRHLDVLKHMGFGIADFGGDTFLVDMLPVCLGQVSAESILIELSRIMERGGNSAGLQHGIEEKIAMAACKSAVKAHHALKQPEIEKLIADLASTEMPYTCPHGRPTLIFMSLNELKRKFGRI